MIIRKKALDDVGLFDEQYFFFFEETDLAYQMRSAGWKIYHVPDAFIYHLQGQSIGHNLHSRMEFYRSRYRFFHKWKSRPVYLILCLVILLRLGVEWLSTSIAAFFTLGINDRFNAKWIVYTRLLQAHFFLGRHRLWP
jgi:hypothetical protein